MDLVRIFFVEIDGVGPSAPDIAPGENMYIAADFYGGRGPYTIDWHFGEIQDPVQETFPDKTKVVNTSPPTYRVEKTLQVPSSLAGTRQSIRIMLTDLVGRSWADSREIEIQMAANKPPSIESLAFADGILTATATDPDNDFLEFAAVVQEGAVRVSRPFNVTSSSASFSVIRENIFVGINFTILVTVEDGRGGQDSDTYSQSFKAFPLEPDTLYAIATSDRTSAGNNVRIVIATGSTANSFQYMNGCGVVCENGASYIAKSFDTGTVDGDTEPGAPIDGVWADMGATDFLLPNDSFIVGTDIGGGLTRTDFNVTPLGGSDITANGLLFSFEYTFASAGNYHLGFEAVSVVSRTYYQDGAADTDYFWSDIDNDHQYNTIVVE